jgi:hypothetical protein
MSNKRRPGTGVRGVSVLPAGGIHKWKVQVHAGFRADGKPNRAHRVFTGTRKQALDFGIDLRNQLEAVPADPGKLTVGGLFETLWLPHKRAQADRNDRSPTTVDGL